MAEIKKETADVPSGTLNDLADLASLERAVLDVERDYLEIAEPFEWFTRNDLDRLLARIAREQTAAAQPAPLPLAAAPRSIAAKSTSRAVQAAGR